MTPEHFITLWKDNKLTERAGAQGDNYCFERGAKKTGGGDGWADVWKRSHFGWKNKKPGSDLNAALKQLTDYALQLENPLDLAHKKLDKSVAAAYGWEDYTPEMPDDEILLALNLERSTK